MTWRRVDNEFARRVQLAIFLIGTVLGLDYLVTPTGSSAVLSSIEKAWLPLWMWGATILGSSVAGFLVEWRILNREHPFLPSRRRERWGWVTNGAHMILVAVFSVLAASALTDIVTRGISEGVWFGFRTSVLWGFYAYVNFQFVKRLAEKPVVLK